MFTDGVGAMIDFIQQSSVPVALLAIAPATNFPSMLARAPGVVSNAVVYAMSGSIHRGYDNSTTPAPGVAVINHATTLSGVETEGMA